MNHKPNISDDEIRSYMNFDQVLADSKRIAGKTIQRRIILMISGALLIVLSIWIFVNKTHGDSTVSSTVQSGSTQSRESVADVPQPPKATYPDAEKKSGTPADDSEKLKAKAAQPDTATKSSNSTQTEDSYVQAEPESGYSNLYAYFAANLKYPHSDPVDTIQGVETISFTINKLGKPEKIVIKHSLGKTFDAEAIRVIENMPLWKPATLNGNPVPSQMSIPLTFRVEKLN